MVIELVLTLSGKRKREVVVIIPNFEILRHLKILNSIFLKHSVLLNCVGER